MELTRASDHRRALIIIPGSVNYFYNQLGRRVAEVLELLGYRVDIRTLGKVPEQEYDLCLLSNIYEVAFSHGDENQAVEVIASLAKRTGQMLAMGMESVKTKWFSHILDMARAAGVNRVLDFGIWDQTTDVADDNRDLYRFVFNGLTPSEERYARADPVDDGREFPWAFVGHQMHLRAALVDFLVRAVDPGGFVYLPSLTPCQEKGSPHLNQQQYEAVLAKSRFQLWCSHHERFYLEGERFRASLLTGGVAVKVVNSDQEVPDGIPYRELVMVAEDLPARLTHEGFLRLRSNFRREALSLPTMRKSLELVLEELERPAASPPGNCCLPHAKPVKEIKQVL